MKILLPSQADATTILDALECAGKYMIVFDEGNTLVCQRNPAHLPSLSYEDMK